MQDTDIEARCPECGESEILTEDEVQDGAYQCSFCDALVSLEERQ